MLEITQNPVNQTIINVELLEKRGHANDNVDLQTPDRWRVAQIVDLFDLPFNDLMHMHNLCIDKALTRTQSR